MVYLEELFHNLKKRPSQGQYFLDKIMEQTELEEYGQYVSMVIYRTRSQIQEFTPTISYTELDDQIVLHNGPMVCLLTTPSWKEQDKNIELKSSIIVFYDAFSSEYIINFNDFYGLLAHHEGMHAKQTYEKDLSVRKDRIGKDIEYAEFEIEAIENESGHISSKNSDNYKRRLDDDLKFWHKKLQEYQAK